MFSVSLFTGGVPMACGTRFFLWGEGTSVTPSARTGGTPSFPRPRQESECCYAAGGKSLAITQEDFLVA